MKKYLLLSCCLASTAYADELEQYCKQIPAVNQKAQQLYLQKKYTPARQQYELSVSYLESCSATKNSLAIAYNNVALTYIKQKDYRKALAWLSLAPNAPQTKTNLTLIPKLAPMNQPQGEYWKYAGQSMWNTYKVTTKKQRAYIQFDGLYVGLNSVMYGPNMGSYAYTTTIKNNQTTWINPDQNTCRIHLSFHHDLLKATSQSPEDCGFGHNVMADGTYQRVL